MYATMTAPMPPAPGNPDEARRVEHERHRYAMMEGRWQPILEGYMETQLGSDYERWFKGCADAPLVQQALHFFLEKQRTSSGEYRDWITRLDRAGTNEAALLLIDQELGEG